MLRCDRELAPADNIFVGRNEDTMSKNKIDPASRGGQYTIDQALAAGLFDGADRYQPSGRPQSWVILYADGRMGRAVVTCYGFELVQLGLHHGRRPVTYTLHPRPVIDLPPKRPTKWREAV